MPNNIYKNFEEMLESMEKKNSLWDKIILHPLMNWLRWLIYNDPDLPRDCYRKVKRGYQRAYRGWADEDVWNLDYYLSKIISETVVKLSHDVHGYPTDLKSIEEWKVILDKIAWTFKINRLLNDMDWVTKKVPGDFHKKYPNIHIMTKEEKKEYEEGWKLFKKYFSNLWD